MAWHLRSFCTPRKEWVARLSQSMRLVPHTWMSMETLCRSLDCIGSHYLAVSDTESYCRQNRFALQDTYHSSPIPQQIWRALLKRFVVYPIGSGLEKRILPGTCEHLRIRSLLSPSRHLHPDIKSTRASMINYPTTCTKKVTAAGHTFAMSVCRLTYHLRRWR